MLKLLDQGQLISAMDYINAQRLRRLYQKRWAAIWKETDVLLTPTVAFEAPAIGQTVVLGQEIRSASTRFARPFNVLGWPAITIPLPTAGLPVGLQIVGRPFAEKEIIAIADLLSRSSG